MITVAIIGILAAIALPSYGAYIVRTNRSDGKAAIMTAAQRLEACYTRFSAYNSADCAVAFPIASENGHYAITVTRDASSYTLTATPQGSQATRDSDCGNLTINQTGVRGVSGSAGVAKCW